MHLNFYLLGMRYELTNLIKNRQLEQILTVVLYGDNCKQNGQLTAYARLQPFLNSISSIDFAFFCTIKSYGLIFNACFCLPGQNDFEYFFCFLGLSADSAGVFDDIPKVTGDMITNVPEPFHYQVPYESDMPEDVQNNPEGHCPKDF